VSLAVDELGGTLSADERMAGEGRPRSGAAAQARQHYEAILAAATRARDELRVAISYRSAPLTQTRLINAHVWANRSLWNAAKDVCFHERLPYEGKEEGILWELAL